MTPRKGGLPQAVAVLALTLCLRGASGAVFSNLFKALRGHAVEHAQVEPAAEPLTNQQLDRIHSIDCLHARIEDPDAPCEGKPQPKEEALRIDTDELPPLNTGSFPNWREERCRGEGEYFCDPGGLLTDDERGNATFALRKFWNDARITCGQLDQRLSGQYFEDNRHFNLGAVVLPDEWPSSETDPQTLQKFSNFLLTHWGFLPIYNGVDTGYSESSLFTKREYTSNCPDSAILILMPKYREVYLASPSCEFLCESRGGPEVMDAMLLAMNQEGGGSGVVAGIEAGATQVLRILNDTFPLSMASTRPNYVADVKDAVIKKHAEISRDAEVWNWTLRVLFVISLGVSLAALGAFIQACLTPQQRRPDAALREPPFRLPPTPNKVPM